MPQYAIQNGSGQVHTVDSRRGVIITFPSSNYPNKQVFFQSNSVIWEGIKYDGDLCDIFEPGCSVNFDAKFLGTTRILIATSVWHETKPCDMDLSEENITSSTTKSNNETFNVVEEQRGENSSKVSDNENTIFIKPKELLSVMESSEGKSLEQFDDINPNAPEKETRKQFISLLLPHCYKEIGVAAIFNVPKDSEENIPFLYSAKGCSEEDQARRDEDQQNSEGKLVLRRSPSEGEVFPGKTLNMEVLTSILERLDIVNLLEVVPHALKRRMSNLNYNELLDLHDCLWNSLCTVSHLISQQGPLGDLWSAPAL